MLKKNWLLGLILIAVFVLYSPIFSVYLVGDDFFHIKISLTDGTLGGFINLFGFHPFSERLIAFYRPITRELVYFTFYRLFGLSQFPFRILSLAIHLVNISLVYLLTKKIFKEKKISLFVMFFYGIAAANLAPLSFSAGGLQTTGAAMFVLMTLILFEKHKILSFITFLFGLASHELSIAGLPLLIGWQFLQMKRIRVKDYLIFIPHVLVTLIYLYLNIKVIGFSQGEVQYQPVFNPKAVINSLAWYSIWAWGMPEMLVDYVRSGLSLNPNLMKFWGQYFKVIFPAFFLSAGVLLGSLVFLLIKARDIFLKREFWFFIFWFGVGLAPVIFLPLHRSSYYLAVSLPAFWIVMGMLSWEIMRKSKVFFGLLILSLLVLNIFSIKVGEKTYWAFQRGQIAGKLVEQIKLKYPILPTGAVVLWTNDPNYPQLSGDWKGSSNQAYFILNGSDALTLLYQDPTLNVFYEDRGGVPEEIETPVYQITAKIN